MNGGNAPSYGSPTASEPRDGVEGDSSDAAPQGEGTRPREKVAYRGGQAFGIEASGERIVYVVDCSDAMGGQGFVSATDGVLKSLETLDSRQRFAVVLFSHDYFFTFFPKRDDDFYVSDATTRMRLDAWFKRFRREALGDPRPVEALTSALALDPDTTFYVGSAGFDSAELVAIGKLNARGIPIHAISINAGADAASLRSLADANGGKFRDVE